MVGITFQLTVIHIAVHSTQDDQGEKIGF